MSELPFGAATEAKYVMLTTFRKDGTPVSAPLWAARDGDQLIMWTVADSWKVKRLRRTPDVIVQACDARGSKTHGDAVAGTAELLDAAGTDRARTLIKRKYGLLGRLIVTGSSLRRGAEGTIGIAITARSPE